MSQQPPAEGRRVSPPWPAVAGGAVFAVSLAVLAAVISADPGRLWSMLDLQIYRWGGQLALHSGDLYGPRFGGAFAFTYPPMAGGIFAVLSPLGVAALKWLMTAASVASLTATVWLAWGLLGYQRSARRVGATLAAASVALWLEPVQQTLQFGQVNLVLMLVIMADLCLPDRSKLKGVGIGLAAGFKLTPLIFIPYLLLTRRFRAAAVASATFALTIVGSLLLLPRESHQFWFGGLFLSSSRPGNPAYVGDQSLRGTLSRLAGGAAAAQPYWIACVLIVGVVGLLVAARASKRGHELAGILACALTGLLVSPISWSHHWVWVAPALVLACGAARRWRWRWWWAAWAGTAAFTALFFAYPLRMRSGVPGGPVVPSGLIWTVTAPAVQGTGARGIQILAGNLYVFAGVAALGTAAIVMTMVSVRSSAAHRPEPAARERAGGPPVLVSGGADPPAAHQRDRG